MTREDLAKTLVEREALVGLSGEEAKAGKETFDNLVEQYGVEKAQQKVKEEGFETLMKQQSVQERLNKSVEKLREVFVSIAQPVLDILDPLVEIVTEILPLVNLILSPVMVAFKAIGKIIQTLIREPLEAVKSIFSGIVDIFKGDFEQGFTKIGKGIIKALVSPVTAIIAGFNSLINGAIDIINKIPGINLGAVDLTSGWKSMVSIDDGIISPDGGLVVSGEKGTYSLNPNDTVVAGTDLGGRGGGRSTGIDIGPLVAEMQNVRAVLQQILAKEGVVYIDSTKAGTAFAVGTSKLQ
jgi:phage-related protein